MFKPGRVILLVTPDPISVNSGVNPDKIEQEPLAPEISLDHDTKNVLGIPAIADTILAKIEKADVFVADVTFTGKGFQNSKLLPNSNVLIELGYAIGRIGDESIVLIMDSAWGSWKKLPFDLLHRRKPVTYSSTGDLEREKGALVDELEAILRMYLERPKSRDMEVSIQAVGPWSQSDFFRFDVYLKNKTAQILEGYYVEITLPDIGATAGQNEYSEQDKLGRKFVFQPHNHPSIVPGGKDFNFRQTKKIQIGPGQIEKIGSISCETRKAADDKRITIKASADGVEVKTKILDLASVLKEAKPKDQ